MNQTVVTVIGTVTTEPTLGRTRRGTTVANFTLVSTARRYLRDQQRWQHTDVLATRVVCWRELADHVSSSLHRGDPVVVHGVLRLRTGTDDDGGSPYDPRGMRRRSQAKCSRPSRLLPSATRYWRACQGPCRPSWSTCRRATSPRSTRPPDRHDGPGPTMTMGDPR